ncbi:MAG: aminotransferase class I/II-fold pyridoxal phosphate-dependent enzyme [Kordiimonadaceae bacterium]|jgi:aspartate aminotransferase|nr:aminotransferase class I/II-fold pyridoxal phosphate-dependent enzyme [Kordiimonadaceae bacterium]MBT6033183.1 aminotransferase class I/II-fold pyridoxal phosphate-dependent enzyme [Kordiimonadaceae bacterium]
MCPQLSNFAQSTGKSTIVGMRRRADELAAKGMRIIDLGGGQPNFNAPEPVKKAAIKAIEDNKSRYLDPSGLPELRTTISDNSQKFHGINTDATQIVVTPGTFGALSITTRAILNPNDEVLVIEPFWGPYRDIISLTGATPIGVSMPCVEGKFILDAELLSKAVTTYTKAILLNTPWNPTGRVLCKEELVAVADVAIKHDLWIISDEVYSQNTFDGITHRSIASLSKEVAERTIIVTSLSKSYAITGWRLGYAIAEPKVAEMLGRINQYSSRGAASMVQYASITAINEGDPFINEMNNEYKSRRDAITKGINDIDGVKCPLAEGGMFAFAEFPASWGDSTDVADYLLNEKGVIVTPGSDFGVASRHHLRLSFVNSLEIINEGIEVLSKALCAKYNNC